MLDGDGGGAVPLEVTRLPVVEVSSSPGGIITGVETSSVVVEFVGEDQLELQSVVEEALVTVQSGVPGLEA